jgi:cytochrome c2
MRRNKCGARTVALAAAIVLGSFFLLGPAKAVAQEADSEAVEQGKEYVWEWYQCNSCHRIDGKGGTLGPELNRVFERRDANFIHRQLEDPRQNNPESQMPEFGLSEDEIKSIMAYLRTLR